MMKRKMNSCPVCGRPPIQYKKEDGITYLRCEKGHVFRAKSDSIIGDMPNLDILGDLVNKNWFE